MFFTSVYTHVYTTHVCAVQRMRACLQATAAQLVKNPAILQMLQQHNPAILAQIIQQHQQKQPGSQGLPPGPPLSAQDAVNKGEGGNRFIRDPRVDTSSLRGS